VSAPSETSECPVAALHNKVDGKIAQMLSHIGVPSPATSTTSSSSSSSSSSDGRSCRSAPQLPAPMSAVITPGGERSDLREKLLRFKATMGNLTSGGGKTASDSGIATERRRSSTAPSAAAGSGTVSRGDVGCHRTSTMTSPVKQQAQQAQQARQGGRCSVSSPKGLAPPTPLHPIPPSPPGKMGNASHNKAELAYGEPRRLSLAGPLSPLRSRVSLGGTSTGSGSVASCNSQGGGAGGAGGGGGGGGFEVGGNDQDCDGIDADDLDADDDRCDDDDVDQHDSNDNDHANDNGNDDDEFDDVGHDDGTRPPRVRIADLRMAARGSCSPAPVAVPPKMWRQQAAAQSPKGGRVSRQSPNFGTEPGPRVPPRHALRKRSSLNKLIGGTSKEDIDKDAGKDAGKDVGKDVGKDDGKRGGDDVNGDDAIDASASAEAISAAAVVVDVVAGNSGAHTDNVPVPDRGHESDSSDAVADVVTAAATTPARVCAPRGQLGRPVSDETAAAPPSTGQSQAPAATAVVAATPTTIPAYPSVGDHVLGKWTIVRVVSAVTEPTLRWSAHAVAGLFTAEALTQGEVPDRAARVFLKVARDDGKLAHEAFVCTALHDATKGQVQVPKTLELIESAPLRDLRDAQGRRSPRHHFASLLCMTPFGPPLSDLRRLGPGETICAAIEALGVLKSIHDAGWTHGSVDARHMLTPPAHQAGFSFIDTCHLSSLHAATRGSHAGAAADVRAWAAAIVAVANGAVEVQGDDAVSAAPAGGAVSPLATPPYLTAAIAIAREIAPGAPVPYDAIIARLSAEYRGIVARK
jgi:hypothetical protein